MSLNYGTLRTEVAELAHRTNMADAKLKSFVRKAEGVIARRLRCTEMMTRTTFEEADRVTGGIYSLPSDYLEDGIIWNADDTPMTKVSLFEIRKYAATIDPTFYCPLSKTEVEFRGSPGSGASLPLVYFARPTAFSADSDVNDILTNHEDVYVDACLSALYLYTQDLELAQAHAQAAEAEIETLNEQAGRLLASARAEGAYCLGTLAKGY